MTRLYRESIPLQVEVTAEGRPAQFEWNGVHFPIAEYHNHWIVDDKWWVKRYWMEYFKVTTTIGMTVILSHDLVDDQWYLKRLYN